VSSAAFHEPLSRREKPKGGSNRSFGFVMAVALSVIALLPVLRHGDPRWWVMGSGLVLGALGLVAPAVLGPLNRGWTAFGLALSAITTPIALGVLYALVFVPIGLLNRLRGIDPLHLRFDPTARTYWISRAQDAGSTLARQY
jgi:hypothetical protein